MSTTWRNILDSMVILDEARTGGLQVFGLRSEALRPRSYLTLDEAIEAGGVLVSELAQASVPFLRISNKLHQPVLAIAGEELVGAKQNRVLNVTLLVKEGAELSVPVSCVEAHRWAGSASFGTRRTLATSRLRSGLIEQTHAFYERTGTPRSDQGAVWAEVSRKLSAVGSRSPSAALHQAYEDHARRIQDMVDAVRPGPEWQGAVLVVAGRVRQAILFDQPATLLKLWSKLVGAHALDLLEEPDREPAGRAAIEELLRSLGEPAEEAFPSPGLGQDLRLVARGARGAALLWDGEPLYAELLFVDEPA